MDNTRDYLQKLRDDLLEQFKGKPNIEVFQKALARQLEELYAFFYQLNFLRWLQTAEGVQLDGIGDIAVMSRTEALIISRLAEQNVPMDDDIYRLYLTWKVNLNTTNCTYRDVYRALKMFWPNTPLYYSEDPAHPATMFFTTPILRPEDNVNILLIAPRIKAAGVALKVIAQTETPDLGEINIRIGALAFPGVMTTVLPQWLPDAIHDKEINVVTFRASVGQTTLPQNQ